MKILHIIPNLTKGGAERLTTDIIRELSKREGISPMLVLLENDIRYDISDIKQYVKVIPSSASVSMLRPERYDIGELQKFVDTFQPDIINSHLFYGDLVSKALISPGAKYFSHVHSNMPVLRNLSWRTLSNRNLLNLFSAKIRILAKYRRTKTTFLAVSHTTLEYLRKGLPKSMWPRIIELKNAINHKAFSTADNDRTLDKIRIINTGTFYPNKNQKLLVQAVNKIKNKGHDVHVTFLGDGAEKEKVKKFAEELGIAASIDFAGAIEDVPSRLAEANIYVHTALSESFGLVLIEAMAAGLPIVTLNGKGNADLVKNGVNGYMIEEPDADKFADRILEVFRDRNEYMRMKKNAVDMARHFDIGPYTDRLIDIYSRIQ